MKRISANDDAELYMYDKECNILDHIYFTIKTIFVVEYRSINNVNIHKLIRYAYNTIIMVRWLPGRELTKQQSTLVVREFWTMRVSLLLRWYNMTCIRVFMIKSLTTSAIGMLTRRGQVDNIHNII